MKTIAAALILASALGAIAPARAQSGALTPAPVPNRGLGEVPPADRAGRPDGSERAAPFSGLPNTLGAGTGQNTPATTGSVDTRTAPSPDLSR